MAIRVFALHNGRRWVRWTLWVSGVLYCLSTTVIITLGLLPVVGESRSPHASVLLNRYSASLRPYHGACVGTVSLSIHRLELSLTPSKIPWYLWATWLPRFATLLLCIRLRRLYT